MIFSKDKDLIEIVNFCTCNNIKLDKNVITYDELSLFIDQQPDNIKQIYLKYFNEGITNE